MLKKKIYKWHRTFSLIIAIPLILSAGSGFMHPIMTNLRPSVATQGVRPVPVDSSQLLVSLRQALDSNHIDSISRFRIIHIDTNWFYQVQQAQTDVPVYMSTRTGKRLPDGDLLYAQYLARLFLEGPRQNKNPPTSLSMAMTADRPSTLPDCCSAATSAVLKAKGSKVLDEDRLTQFDEEYNEINRLLPVYKVAFDRPDGMRIYVETAQDRFSLAVDHRRAAFNKVFQYIHTYQWLDFLGAGKQVVIFLLMAMAFLTTLMGVYIFFSTKSKKVPGNGYVKARRNHRYSAIIISLFTLMFTFSGGYHALSGLKVDRRNSYFVTNHFAAQDMGLDYRQLQQLVRQPITGISLVQIERDRYWQITTLPMRKPDNTTNDAPMRKDLMKDMQVNAPSVIYINVASSQPLQNGEKQYAEYLATRFSGHPSSDILATAQITKFDRDYNFTDKRLPVWKVGYPQNGHERYYVETSTGSLSVRVNDWDLVESYSFALLHKHEFLGGIGKWAKDTSTMFWAAAQLFMVGLGLFFYFKWIRRQKKKDIAYQKSNTL
jgi:hypothetical protein